MCVVLSYVGFFVTLGLAHRAPVHENSQADTDRFQGILLTQRSARFPHMGSYLLKPTRNPAYHIENTE